MTKKKVNMNQSESDRLGGRDAEDSYSWARPTVRGNYRCYAVVGDRGGRLEDLRLSFLLAGCFLRKALSTRALSGRSMGMRYWLLTIGIAVGTVWLLTDMIGLPLAAFVAIWPSSVVAFTGMIVTDREAESLSKNLSDQS